MQEPPVLTVAAYEMEEGTLVELAGVLDASTADTLREALAALHLDGGSALRIDLGALSVVDSSGRDVLVAACRRVRASGGTFQMACGPGLVRESLWSAGLVDYLQLDGSPSTTS